MLTQLSTLKVRLGIEAFETADDLILTSLLKHVSARFAAECNRIFDYGVGLTFEFPAEEWQIIVDRPPIERVTRFDLKSMEREGWIVQPEVEHLLSPKRTVIALSLPLGAFNQLGRVTYSGGYVPPGVTPLGNEPLLPDDLEQACVEQAAYWYQRRGQLGLLSVSSDSGLVQQFQRSDLLPQVQAVR